MKEKKLIEFVKKVNWYRQETDSVSFFMHDPIHAVFSLMRSGAHNIGYHTIDQTRFYINISEFTKKAKRFLNKVKADKRYLKKTYGKWGSWNRQIKKLAHQVREMDLRTITNDELLRINNKTAKLSYSFWFRYPFLDIFDPCADQLIKEHLDKFNVKMTDEVLGDLLQPEESSFAQKYKLELLKLIKKNHQSSVPELELKKLEDRFFFINCSYSNGTGKSIKDIRRDLKQLQKKTDNGAEYNKLKNYTKKVKQKKSLLFKKLQVDQELRQVLEFFSFITVWREERKAVSQHLFYVLDKVGRQIAFRSQQSWGKVQNLPPRAIKSIPVKEELVLKHEKKLKENPFFVYDKKNKNAKYFSKNFSARLEKALEQTSNSQEIWGQPASGGKVKGKVRIINGEKDFDKFKAGEVLVTSMTRPEFLPLMTKAKAIVTDEGGIASHAAIVSRELGVPCIIGTREATRVLKTGQTVSVDADKGVVRLL